MPLNMYNSLARYSLATQKLVKDPSFVASNNLNSMRYGNTGCAISNNGQYILTCHHNGGAYVSNNYGSTFTKLTSPTSDTWTCAISGNGQYMLIGNSTGYIHRSTNYGETFTENTTGSLPKSWQSIKMSYDGQYCLASSDFVYLSSNYGANFAVIKDTSGTDISPGYSTSQSDIAMSKTGQYMIRVKRVTPTDGIVISTDYGVTWKQKTFAILTNFSNSCAMSEDGQTVFVGSVYFPKLYKITNLSDNTPTVTEITKATELAIVCSCILVSSDALYIFISDRYNAKMYYSTNGGSSFKLINTTTYFLTAAMTSNASIIIGNNTYNNLYKLYISNV